MVQAMTLYLKYRPQDLSEVYGNEQTKDAISAMLRDPEERPHSFLLHGPTGCGKTTIGRIIAQTLECVGMDLTEVDSADFRGIDTVREIRKRSYLKPLESPCRVWIIDECHKMTNDAQNALLKILEDTPSHVYFILCTTEPQKLLKTIRGRCSQFQLNPLEDKELRDLLREVVKAEGEQLTGGIYKQIIQDSLGHPRNALQILDQVLRVEPEARLEMARRSAEEQSEAIELCRALLRGGGWDSVKKVLASLAEQKQDPESIRRLVLAYCNSVLTKEWNPTAGLIMSQFIYPFYDTGFPGLTHACFTVLREWDRENPPF